MTSLLLQPVSNFASAQRKRSDARAIDLQAFFLTAQTAQNSDQLRDLMVRNLRAAGVAFLQLATYRRLQFASLIWTELPNDITSSVSDCLVDDAIACRALSSGLAERWECADLEPPTPDGTRWSNLLIENGICAGATIAIRGGNDWSYIFHFAAAEKSCFDAGPDGVGAFSTLGFIASQRLAKWHRRSAEFKSEQALTERELEVICWCKDGKSYPEIAQILGISAKTVEFHIAKVMRKLGVNQKISAIVEAARLGLIDL